MKGVIMNDWNERLSRWLTYEIQWKPFTKKGFFLTQIRKVEGGFWFDKGIVKLSGLKCCKEDRHKETERRNLFERGREQEKEEWGWDRLGKGERERERAKKTRFKGIQLLLALREASPTKPVRVGV